MAVFRWQQAGGHRGAPALRRVLEIGVVGLGDLRLCAVPQIELPRFALVAQLGGRVQRPQRLDQHVEVRRRLSANQSAQIPVVNDLNRVEEYLHTKTFSAEDQKQIEYSVEMNKSKLALARKEEQELRAQETDLANQLATEQSQWVDFNARLDALEQQLPVSQR